MWVETAVKPGEQLEPAFLAKMFNMSSEEFEELRSGAQKIKFSSPEDIDAWVVDRADGELALRFALAMHSAADEVTQRLAEVWLLTKEQSRTDSRAKVALEASERSAAAAEASARWTLVAAIVAAVGTVVTAAGVIFSALATPVAPPPAASMAPLLTPPSAEAGPRGR